MKKKSLLLLVAMTAAIFLSACSSKNGQYGKREISLLGGLVEVKKESYDEVGPLAIGLKTSEINPNADLDGDRTSFLWGLIVIADD